jgi:hypothetical protein
VIQDRTHFGLFIAVGEDVQVLFGPVVFARKAKQFKEKRAPRRVGRVVPNLGGERPYCLVQLAGLV